MPLKKLTHIWKFCEAGVPICNWTAVIWLSNNIQLSINNKCRLICQLWKCAALFDGKFDSGRMLYVSREQQDVQSFADGKLQHKLNLSKWRVN